MEQWGFDPPLTAVDSDDRRSPWGNKVGGDRSIRGWIRDTTNELYPIAEMRQITVTAIRDVDRSAQGGRGAIA
ncbi:MAG: hypothetical protein WBA43_15200 [Elainellaceae cyanobacterium]